MVKRESKAESTANVTGKGRPRNYNFAVKDELYPFTYIGTDRTANEWRKQGGAKAFLSEMTKMMMRKDVREQLKRELS